jgi:sec-independent protein translocase protein TatA
MFGLSPMELMIVGGIALLLFGSRLPEVARGLGKSVVEFKRGLNGIQDEITGNTPAPSYTPPRASRVREDREEPSAPKFEPPVEAT